MPEKLTKEAFEAGKPFIVLKALEHGNLYYRENHDHQTLRRYPSYDFFCSVERVDETGFQFSYTFLNEPVNGFIQFKDCILYERKN